MRADPFLALCVATRGLAHLRAVASLIAEVEAVAVPHVWCWSFGLPIPDAQNSITQQALADRRVTHLLFFEDDQLAPVGVLQAMLAADQPIVTVDYRGRHDRGLIQRHPVTGDVLLTPMGVLLVRREVFARIADPPWQVGTRWEISESGEWQDTGKPEWYGGHDGFFSRQVLAAGYTIHQLAGFEAGHLETRRLSPRDVRTNYGADTEHCWGGVNVRFRPKAKEGEMAERVFLKSPAGHVIDMDPDESEYEVFIKRGFTRVAAAAAKPALKAQEKRGEEIIAERNGADDGRD